MLEVTDYEKKLLKEISENEDLAEAFYEEIVFQMDTDEEPYGKKGKKLARHLAEGSIQDVMLDLCGWSICSLYDMAVERMKD